MSKQNLWFLTLFSLILVLSVYYITMPNDLLLSTKKEEVVTDPVVKESIEEISSLVALRVSLEEERQNEMDVLQEQLTNGSVSSEEKNNAYETIKSIDEIKSKEEVIKKKIKEKMKLSSFVKVDSNSVSIVIKNKEHDYSLANNIMRLAQEEFDNKMYISVKFQN